MPKYLITETRRELWSYFFEIEADSREEALKLWNQGEATHIGYEYIETVASDYDIEEDKHDAA